MVLPVTSARLGIYLNVIITWYIFSDGLIDASILEHFNLTLDQLQSTNTLNFV